MVSKNSLDIVSKAIESFYNQSYTNKELIIVIDNNNPNKNYFNNIKKEDVKILIEDNEKTLGELRNVALNNMKGDIFIQWDDDDIYSNERILYQYNNMFNQNKDGNLLVGNKILKNKITYNSDARIFQGSLMYKKSKLKTFYPSIRMHEDTALIENNNILENVSFSIGYDYYTYVIHNNNTYGKTYFELNKKLFQQL